MPPISLELDKSEIEELKNYIRKIGLKKVRPKSEYELLRIKDGKVSIVVYTSGKVVHNGTKESQQVIDAVLKKEKTFDYILGSDETGKGEWYGPLVVEGVALTPDLIMKCRKMGVRDSKGIAKPQLMKLAQKLVKLKFPRKLVILKPEVYNSKYKEFQNERKTLNDMLAWAHSAVVKDLLKEIKFNKAKVVIDKFDFQKTEYRLSNVDRTNLEIIQKTKGESEISVALASIIAKYVFENEVDELNKKYAIDLRNATPAEIDPKILPFVAKLHFKNVKKYL
jgi:ribonuclease HIII